MSTSACHDLFAYTARGLTPQDIADFCPGDPGYGDYVETFNTILRTRIPPVTTSFEISETIGLSTYVGAETVADPVRYRRTRVFANAVGACLYVGPCGGDDHNPANYLAITLLDDAWALQDATLLVLLTPAFAELHARLLTDDPNESPFFLLAQLILAFLGYAPSVDQPQLAAQLIAGAAQYNEWGSTNFLFGCTVYDQLQHRWLHFVRLSFPRKTPHEDITLLRDELLAP